MDASAVERLLQSHGALQTGHFKLSSGKHSDTFAQTALVLRWPALAEQLGRALADRFARSGADVVIGPALAGIVIGHEVARALDIPMIFSERVDGAMQFRRGFAIGPGDRALIAENAVTTGGSQLEVIELVGQTGAEVVGVGSVVDRSVPVDFGVPYEYLLRIAPEHWDVETCPLCAEGIPLEAPGSRHLSG